MHPFFSFWNKQKRKKWRSHILFLSFEMLLFRALNSQQRGHLVLRTSKTVCRFSDVYWDKSSHWRCSMKKDVLINFTIFTGKHLFQSFFFDKIAGLRPATLFKKRLWYRCFPVNFAKYLITPFSQNTSGRLLLLRGIFRTYSAKSR